MCRVGVEPEEPQACANQGGAEYDQLARARYIGNKQVFGKLHVARQVAENPQRAADHHGRQNRQAIQAIGEVDCVARADDHEVGQHDKTQAQLQAEVLKHRQNQGGFHRALRGHKEKERGTQAEHRLPKILPAARQPLRILLDHLAVVIDPTNGTEQQGHGEYSPHVAIGQVSPKQRADGNGRENQRATHGRRALLRQMRLRAIIAHRLANLTNL